MSLPISHQQNIFSLVSAVSGGWRRGDLRPPDRQHSNSLTELHECNTTSQYRTLRSNSCEARPDTTAWRRPCAGIARTTHNPGTRYDTHGGCPPRQTHARPGCRHQRRTGPAYLREPGSWPSLSLCGLGASSGPVVTPDRPKWLLLPPLTAATKYAATACRKHSPPPRCPAGPAGGCACSRAS